MCIDIYIHIYLYIVLYHLIFLSVDCSYYIIYCVIELSPPARLSALKSNSAEIKRDTKENKSWSMCVLVRRRREGGRSTARERESPQPFGGADTNMYAHNQSCRQAAKAIRRQDRG